LFCYVVGVLCTFFLAENLYLGPKQWNRKLQSENYPRIQHYVRRTASIRSARTANQSPNRNRLPLFAARKFFFKPQCGPSCSQPWTTLF